MKRYEHLSRLWKLWYALEEIVPCTLTESSSLEEEDSPTELKGQSEISGDGSFALLSGIVSAPLIELLESVVKEKPIPGSVRKFIASSASPLQAAKRIRRALFVAPHIAYKQRANNKLFKDMQGYDSPNPKFIPSREEIQLIEEGIQYFKLPFEVPPDALVRLHSSLVIN